MLLQCSNTIVRSVPLSFYRCVNRDKLNFSVEGKYDTEFDTCLGLWRMVRTWYLAPIRVSDGCGEVRRGSRPDEVVEPKIPRTRNSRARSEIITKYEH